MTTRFRHFLEKYKSKFRYYIANSVNLRQITQLVLVLISLAAIVGPIVLLVFEYEKSPSVRLIILGLLSAAIATFFGSCVALWWWRFAHPPRDDNQQVIPWSRSGSESSSVGATQTQLAAEPSDTQGMDLPLSPITEQAASSVIAEVNVDGGGHEGNNATTPSKSWNKLLGFKCYTGDLDYKHTEGALQLRSALSAMRGYIYNNVGHPSTAIRKRAI
ncbi:uncharacterized protein BDZ83DRAFT_649884 [Colletotrichum acutatum]|uniref:Uncharacterized protein n=1 Tax=Glomerella acutata TaxID=27357 RepID=A0AAD8UTX1_GLOAC|nr:uncharacterized protein BDZ83DRAFT_649884 [Colletotrichum acutatum]KAK1727044.1 hypothetical protein BDZ83DRAFT_649884 [Colletotrichum acutatum]